MLKRLFLACLGLLMAAGRVQATTIEIGLGGPGQLLYDKTVAFSDLNGASLGGQDLSLDFRFSGDEFVRIFTVTTSYVVAVKLQTSALGLPGFLQGTGYLLDQFGNALCTPQNLGSAASSDGSMLAGLFPLWSGEIGHPSDHYGVHYDLKLPVNPTVNIIGGEFRLFAYDGEGPFGIGPGLPPDIVPDTGGTLLFLGVSVAGLVALRRRMSAAG